MEDYSYASVRKMSQMIRETEERAKVDYAAYDESKEPEYYAVLHNPDAPEEEKEKIRTIIVGAHAYLIIQRLSSFSHTVKTPQDMEDLLMEGHLYLLEVLLKWDIKKGSYGAAARMEMNRLYRAYHKMNDLRPQSSIQNDAKVKAYDNKHFMETGKIASAEEAAKDLGRSVKSIEKTRLRNAAGIGQVESLDKIKEDIPGLAEGLLKALDFTPEQVMMNYDNNEFIRRAKSVLTDPVEKIIFDFLINPESDRFKEKIDTLREIIFCATGLNYSYTTIRNARNRIGARLIYKGIITNTSKDVKWLPKALAEVEKQEKGKRNTYAYLWA